MNIRGIYGEGSKTLGDIYQISNKQSLGISEEETIKNLEKAMGRKADDPYAENCMRCADEHRQLAEWLRELRELREKTHETLDISLVAHNEDDDSSQQFCHPTCIPAHTVLAPTVDHAS